MANPDPAFQIPPDAGALSALYDAHFDVVRVRTAGLLDAVYRLRYQVYCVEHPFENPAEHPDGREIDAFDVHSIHAALIHRESRAVVGTVRIVLPHPQHGLAGLPIMNLVDDQVRRQLAACAAQGMAEVSRYAVTRRFRTGGLQAADDCPVPKLCDSRSAERRLMPYVTLGLLRAAIGLCREEGLAYMAAIMEPTLIRLLTRFGVHFTPIGPLVAYHGHRQPSVIAVDAMEHGIVEKSRDFGETVRGPLKAEANAQFAAFWNRQSSRPRAPSPGRYP